MLHGESKRHVSHDLRNNEKSPTEEVQDFA